MIKFDYNAKSAFYSLAMSYLVWYCLLVLTNHRRGEVAQSLTVNTTVVSSISTYGEELYSFILYKYQNLTLRFEIRE